MSSYGLTTDVVVTVQLQQSSDNDRHRRQHHTNHAVYAQASVVLSAGRLRLMSQIQRVHFSQRIDMRDTLVPWILHTQKNAWLQKIKIYTLHMQVSC